MSVAKDHSDSYIVDCRVSPLRFVCSMESLYRRYLINGVIRSTGFYTPLVDSWLKWEAAQLTQWWESIPEAFTPISVHFSRVSWLASRAYYYQLWQSTNCFVKSFKPHEVLISTSNRNIEFVILSNHFYYNNKNHCRRECLALQVRNYENI